MIAFLLWLLCSPAWAVDVVCTVPWLGAITHELAPDAEITVLARANQDPHYLSPTPALMAKVARADLYVLNGLSLELWSERLIDGAGNPKIRPGSPGYVIASTGVPRLQVPVELTRAQGDLHPEGNPHIWTDPLNAGIVADNIAAGLARVDPTNAALYTQRAKAFRQQIWERTFGTDLVGFMGGELLERLARNHRLDDLLTAKGLTGRLGGWLGTGRAMRGQPVVFYHQSWVYFIDRFGLQLVGTIEEKPGISPSAAHRRTLEDAMRAAGVKVIGITSYYDDRLAHVLGDATGARVEVLPGDVGGVAGTADYFAYIDFLVAHLGP